MNANDAAEMIAAATDTRTEMAADGEIMDGGAGTAQFEVTGPDGERFTVTVERA